MCHSFPALSLLQAVTRLPIQYIKFIMTLFITVNNTLPFFQLSLINMTAMQPGAYLRMTLAPTCPSERKKAALGDFTIRWPWQRGAVGQRWANCPCCWQLWAGGPGCRYIWHARNANWFRHSSHGWRSLTEQHPPLPVRPGSPGLSVLGLNSSASILEWHISTSQHNRVSICNLWLCTLSLYVLSLVIRWNAFTPDSLSQRCENSLEIVFNCTSIKIID